MDFDGLFVCPECESGLSADWRCGACARSFARPDGVPDLTTALDEHTERIRAFYESAPFPGYPPRATPEWLRARAERSDFARMLDAAIAAHATILEVGCGTGQMSLYLARGGRRVVGADLARASLRLAASAAERFGLADSVRFVRTDLHRPGLRDGAFDVVYSSGVLHHTADPAAAFARIARLARPGGWIIIGLYNAFARIPTVIRRALRRTASDPVLRARANEPARREAWFRDQYEHPSERRHTVGEVQRWFSRNGVEYVRTVPSALLASDSEALFEPCGDAWAPEQWLAQLSWMKTLGGEGGLFVTVGRRT